MGTLWYQEYSLLFGLLKIDKDMFEDDFLSKSSLHGLAGVHFDVKGSSPKIDIDICEELENQSIRRP